MHKKWSEDRVLRLSRPAARWLLATALIMTGHQALAQAAAAKEKKPAAQPAAAQAHAAQTPSSSVVINLIRLLVQEGVLTQDKANTLIRQAEDEAAAAARGQTGVNKQPAVAPKAVASAGAPPSVRVPYIPEIVRKQIRDEVKQEVLQEAKAENWAAPNQIPEWTQKIRLSGDFRARYEWDVFDKRNSPFFINFPTLNAGAPFDLNNSAGTPPPQLDTTADRQRMRERFRLGIDADIDDNFQAGLRLATGNTTNPTSTNLTLGNSLANDSFDLDRAFLRYSPASWLTVTVGRFADPWFSTDLVWDDDVNFDGAVVQMSQRFGEQWTPFLTFGALPIANTPFNFPDNTSDKSNSRDVWLYAAQTGVDWRPSHDYDLKVGLAYYYYDHLQGEQSLPCTAPTSADPCSTDNTRPLFMQQGNTLFAIRNLVNTGQTNPPQFQYYGLASNFHELNLTTRFDFAGYDPIHIVTDLDFVKNLGFNKAAISGRVPVNNRGPSPDMQTPGPWDGGDSAFQARMLVGYPVLRERWDWNFYVGYKYIESDSVVDAFTDSDFHLGGTNAKGYFFGGGLGIAKDIDLSARWLSAREVTGPAYSADVIQIDLNGRF